MKRKLFGIVLGLATVIGLFGAANGIAASYSQTENAAGNHLAGWQSTLWSQTVKSEYELGDPDNVDTATYPGDVIISEMGGGAGGQLFALRGDNTDAFWSYNIIDDSWTTDIAQAPAAVYEGGALVHDGSNYIYAFRGNDTKNFWRYSISDNSWTSRANAPDKIGKGGALVYDSSDNIYAFRGNDTKTFWRYSISGNSWTARADALDKVGDGGSLVYDGSGNIYAFRGNGTKNFWKYSISGNSWTSLLNTPGNVGLGGSLAFNGPTYIYALRGSNSNHFWRYNISANSWTAIEHTPSSIDEGGSLAYDGADYLYALRGDGTAFFWRYSISSGHWDESLSSAPDSVHRGGALYLVSGGGTGSAGTGTLASKVLNTHLTGAKLNALFWEETLPSGDTDITFEVRCSSSSFDPDNETIPWTPVGGDSPVISFSPPLSGQYMQWRATLTTTDSAQTPVLHEVRLYYY